MQRVGRVDPHRTQHPRRRPSPCTIFPWVPRPPRRSAAARILHGGTNAAVNRPRTEGRPEQRRRGATSRGVALTGCRRAVKRKGAAPHGSAGHLAPAKARGPPHRAGVLFGWKGPPAWRHGQEAETRLDTLAATLCDRNKECAQGQSRKVTQRRTPAARRAAWRPSWPFMEAPWNGFGRSGWRVPRDRRVAEPEEHSRVRDTADSGSDLDDSDESGDEEDGSEMQERIERSLGECPGVKIDEIGQSCNDFLTKITRKLASSGPSPFGGAFPGCSAVCPGLSGALDLAKTAGGGKTVGWSPVI